jgi:lipopolysaccharide/colanic/teichoic acid biosynthesis glycosyltransferase
MDIALAGSALVLLSPVLALVAIAIALTLGRPVLFRQVRPGHKEVPFALVKFRTMRAETSRDGRRLSDRERTTPLGHFLRRTSLDELPELWNILKGDMSLVGPRPLLMEYLPLYNREQHRRHDVPPGLTGWAQVNGRRFVQMQERLAQDVWYVDHWSLGLDLRILARTVGMVLKGEGAEARVEIATQDLGWDPQPSGPVEGSGATDPGPGTR